MLGLPLDVEGIGRVHLHSVSQFKGGNSRLQLFIINASLLMLLIEPSQQIQLSPLLCGRNRKIANVLNQIVDLSMLRIDVGPLVDTRQESALPILRFLNGIAARAHGDESGEILILRSQAIGDPGPHRRSNQPSLATVHQHQGRLMVGGIRMHRSDDGDLIDHLPHSGKEVTDRNATLTIPPERKGRGESRAGLALGAEVFHGKGFPRIPVQHRFRIKGIDMGGPAIHEEMDDGLGFSGKVG